MLVRLVRLLALLAILTATAGTGILPVAHGDAMARGDAVARSAASDHAAHAGHAHGKHDSAAEQDANLGSGCCDFTCHVMVAADEAMPFGLLPTTRPLPMAGTPLLAERQDSHFRPPRQIA